MMNNSININGPVTTFTVADKVNKTTTNYHGGTTITNVESSPQGKTEETSEQRNNRNENTVQPPTLVSRAASETSDELPDRQGAQGLVGASSSHQAPPSHTEMISKISEVLQEHPDYLYDMEKGFVQIINNIEFRDSKLDTRRGSKEDEKSLKEFFEREAGWTDVYSSHNLSVERMIEVIGNLSARDFGRFEAFVFIILSHGCEEGIYGVDGKVLDIEKDILLPFSADSCPTLADKPKIFIMQACRGDMTDEGYMVYKTDAMCTKAPVYSHIPKFSEYLVLYPSSPGFNAIRHESLGTYYIQALVTVFKNFYRHEHLIEMLLRVNFKMTTMEGCQTKANGTVGPVKSMPCMDVRLKRKYYFHRGILERYNELKNRNLIKD